MHQQNTLVRTIDLRKTLPSGGAADLETASSSSIPHRKLNPQAIAFLTLVDDEAQYNICLRYIDALQIPPGYAMEKVAVFGASSMAEGYRQAMEASTARYKIYVHQDVYLIHRGLLFELVNLFRTYPRLGLLGVVGATRLPGGVLYSANNPFHCFGRSWDYRRPGGLWSFLGPANSRRLHFTRFRSFVGDYMPAVVVDGFFMATQYDIPWTNPLGGFELYDQVQALEFIKAGLEVGIARQQAVWCLHWGRLREPSHEEHSRRRTGIYQTAAAYRRLYQAFIGVPALRLFEQYRGAAGQPGAFAGETGDGVSDQRAESGDFKSPHPARERLGVAIVTFNSREILLRALRALLPQCDALKNLECKVVVVDNASTDDTVEAVRREFPQVTVIANASNEGPARGFNIGLRHLGFANYVLVMNNDVELLPGTLARMVGYLSEHPLMAGVVASLTNPDGTVQFQRTAILELIARHPHRPQPITFVGTTCALIRGDVLLDVGLYDERFYFYNEDLEWSLRAKRKGYRFVFLPEARVIHHQGMGLRQNRPAILAELLVANLWFAYKHAGPRWATVLYWAQRLQGRWFAFLWRKDREALRVVSEAVARMEALYHRVRNENRLPPLLSPEES